MKKVLLVSVCFLVISIVAFSQSIEPMEMKAEMTEIWDPEVAVVTPGKLPFEAPSDAIVLFDGTDLEREWEGRDGSKPAWEVKDGCVTVVNRGGRIKTKRVFEDFQLHVEWRTPDEITGEGQGRGNSGVFLQERYEVQILDSYNNRTYRNGQAASIYKQFAPMVNACKPPGEWQTYDIIYTAPRFNKNGTYFTPPVVTLIHNGVLVLNNVKLKGPTLYIGIPEYAVEQHGPASIVLQGHGNPVSFRNIWIREL